MSHGTVFAAVPVQDYYLSEKTAILNIDQIKAVFNGKEITLLAPPREVNGRTLVPLRFLELFDLTVTWDDNTNTAKITEVNHTVEVTPGKTSVIIDGEETSLDVPAQLIEGRVYVPIRFAAENFGAGIKWDEKSGNITIVYKKLILAKYNMFLTLPPGYSVKQINDDYVELIEKDEKGIIVIEPCIKEDKELNKIAFASITYNWKKNYEAYEIFAEFGTDITSGIGYFNEGLVNLEALKLLKDQICSVRGYYPENVFNEKMANDLDIIIFTLEHDKQNHESE